MSFLDIPAIGFYIGTSRKIDTFTGFITIQENTTDNLEITQQPVQQGAMIADHAFKKPTNLSIQVQFKPSVFSSIAGVLSNPVSALSGAVGDIVGVGGGSSSQLSKLYQQLLELQNARTPFIVTTPKRIYRDMLFANLGVTTDKKTENVLAINAQFQQVIIVNVTTTSIPRKNQKQPGVTGATENAGKKSALFTLTQGIQGVVGR